MNATPTPDRPNVVLILADDLGFSDLGSFGGEIRTPHLDRLAAGGVRLTQMYNSARCCPSRAALLTGLHPHQAGVGYMTAGPDPRTNLNTEDSAYQGYLRDGVPTIADVLSAAGYQTSMSGKWHVARQFDRSDPSTWPNGQLHYPLPRQRGFDEFWGMLGGAASYFDPQDLMEGDTPIGRGSEDDWYLTDEVTANAIRMIDAAVDRSQPFFAYVAYTAPHWPLHAPPEDIAAYEGAYAEGWDVTRARRHEMQRDLGLVPSSWSISKRDPTAWPWEETRYPDWEAHRMAVYAAQVSRMDAGIGEIVAKLEERGELENTLIMFLSDNGGCAEFLKEDVFYDPSYVPSHTLDGRRVTLGNRPGVWAGPDDTYQSYDVCWANASNSPFRLFKRWVHEGGISTPFIAHWPDRWDGGAIMHTESHLIDIVPTILEAAGVERRDLGLEGHSMVGLLSGHTEARPTPIFFEHEGNRAMREGEWKLVSAFPGRWELYNIAEDRSEQFDLADREAARVRQMARQWTAWARRIGVDEDFRHRYRDDFADYTMLHAPGRMELLRS